MGHLYIWAPSGQPRRPIRHAWRLIAGRQLVGRWWESRCGHGGKRRLIRPRPQTDGPCCERCVRWVAQDEGKRA